MLAVAAASLALVPPVQAGELVRLRTNEKVVALTFDGGSDAVGAPAILRTLRRERAAGTFFLTGRWVRTYPQLARTIAARGYPIANHTWDHLALPGMPARRIREEIVRAARAIRAVTHEEPRPLFRFPYGARDARTLRIVRALGYVSVRWTVDTLGWLRVSERAVVDRVVRNLQPGEIVLMHLGRSTDSAALGAVVRAIRAHGYRLVTLASVRYPLRA
jgi:peptidoglycan/xylan/chitin deacetylase (PgdA/CDA1 family)